MNIIKHRRILWWVLITYLKGVVMGKKKVKRSKARKVNRKKVQKGDKYVVTNDIEVADVDGDGVADVTAKHQVTKNGELFVSAEIVWYGLEDEVADAFVVALEDAGVVDDDVVETEKFGEVARMWKKLTKFMARINDLADVKADEVD
jgi:hypothetical protein